MRTTFASVFSFLTKPVVALGGAVVIALVLVALALSQSAVKPAGDYVAASRGTVTATGGVSSDLSFEVPGQIAQVSVALNQKVNAGQLLVALDSSALQATRAGAKANVEAAEARLAALQAGTRPEQLAINETAVSQADATLHDTIRSAYITADDAIHNKADAFFTNARTANPALTFTPSDQTLQNTLLAERVSLEGTLASWGSAVNDADFSENDALAAAADAKSSLTQVVTFLNNAATMLAEVSATGAVPLTTVQGYQSSITAARVSVAAAVGAITSATTALENTRGALTLAQAGATSNDIAAAQAAVDAANANLRSVEVTLGESALYAPVAGTVTALTARLGQTVAPGQVLVSLESIGGTKENALTVPTSAVITSGNQTFVYRKGAAGPVKTVVTTGLTSARVTEIVSGLAEGDQVLTFGIAN